MLSLEGVAFKKKQLYKWISSVQFHFVISSSQGLVSLISGSTRRPQSLALLVLSSRATMQGTKVGVKAIRAADVSDIPRTVVRDWQTTLTELFIHAIMKRMRGQEVFCKSFLSSFPLRIVWRWTFGLPALVGPNVRWCFGSTGGATWAARRRTRSTTPRRWLSTQRWWWSRCSTAWASLGSWERQRCGREIQEGQLETMVSLSEGLKVRGMCCVVLGFLFGWMRWF